MSAASSRNVPLFIAFRVVFNARWYYPILAVLFLDFGLSIDQYALLNVAWAVSIVLLEVPTGALADQIGRRRILILASLLMIAEMSLLAFVPLGSSWLFPVFLLNRILSGAAEACASGADESLAYDSLNAEGRADQWPAILARLMRYFPAKHAAGLGRRRPHRRDRQVAPAGKLGRPVPLKWVRNESRDSWSGCDPARCAPLPARVLHGGAGGRR